MQACARLARVVHDNNRWRTKNPAAAGFSWFAWATGLSGAELLDFNRGDSCTLFRPGLEFGDLVEVEVAVELSAARIDLGGGDRQDTRPGPKVKHCLSWQKTIFHGSQTETGGGV